MLRFWEKNCCTLCTMFSAQLHKLTNGISILIGRTWCVPFIQAAATWTWRRKLLKTFLKWPHSRQNMKDYTVGISISFQALFYLNIWYCGYREFGRKNNCKLLQRVCERFDTWDSVEFLGGAFRDRGKARGVSSDPPTKGRLSFSLRISISQRRRFSHWEDTAWLHSPHAF